MRVFVAIPLPEPARDALERVQDALPPGLGRATDPEALHLTLAFLGERTEDEVVAAHEALDTLRLPLFPLQLSGLGAFRDGPRHVVWAGVADPAPVAALHAKVLSALHGAGLVVERRRFRPHVTLARMDRADLGGEERLAAWLSRWHSFPAPPFEVDAFALVRSTLRPEGALHEELARYPLGSRV